MPLPLLRTWCESQHLPFSPEQEAQCEAFLDKLYETNKVMNLTRIPREEAEVKHLIDSLLPQYHIHEEALVLDTGSGPGFPAWPLACLRPDIEIQAVDSTEKIVGFLKSVAPKNLNPRCMRVEELNTRGKFDVGLGRAFAPLGIQLEATAPWVKLGGIVMPYRTPNDREEAETMPCGQLGLELEEIIEMSLPDGSPRLFPIYRKVRETPTEFPRPWGRMKLRPLKGIRKADQGS